MSAFDPNASSEDAVWYVCFGGKVRLRLDDPTAPPGKRSGKVINESGAIVGEANDSIYGGRGYSVWTTPFAGFVEESQIEYVPVKP